MKIDFKFFKEMTRAQIEPFCNIECFSDGSKPYLWANANIINGVIEDITTEIILHKAGIEIFTSLWQDGSKRRHNEFDEFNEYQISIPFGTKAQMITIGGALETRKINNSNLEINFLLENYTYCIF